MFWYGKWRVLEMIKYGKIHAYGRWLSDNENSCIVHVNLVQINMAYAM